MGSAQSTVDSYFGGLLRRLRRAAGLTQEELAEKAGVAPETISALERGVNRAPHQDTVLALAEALGLSPEERAALQAAARRPLPAPRRSTLPPERGGEAATASARSPASFPGTSSRPTGASAGGTLGAAGTANAFPLPPANLPVQTFLIADMRGYTRFTLDRGDEAAARLAARFATLARDAVSAREGGC